MKNKINLFVCILIVLLINLQCNISVYAQTENNEATIEEEQNSGIDSPNKSITGDSPEFIEGTTISSGASDRDELENALRNDIEEDLLQ